MIYFNNKLGIHYYDVEELPSILNKIATNNKLKFVGNNKRKYLDISASFDIETTSFRDKDNNKLSLMYIWQFGILDDSTGFTYCIIGRTWEEWQIVMDILSEVMENAKGKAKYYFPIYVHNLSFEYFFIKHLLDIEDTFVTKSNTILYCRTNNHLEFRCSYFLSGCGLSSITNFLPKTTNLKKLVGDLDYDIIRTPVTNITDEEMAYCLNDVRLVCEYIRQKRVEDGDIAKIPLTKTGYARRGIVKHCMPDDKTKRAYIRTISGLKFHNALEFLTITKAYMGGHTAANPLNNGKILDDVTCYDFSSSYPSVMVGSNEFPTDFIEYKDILTEVGYKVELNLNHAMVCKFIFKNLRPREYSKDNCIQKVLFDSFIPFSKCEELQGRQLNNGKVVNAEYLEIFGTDMDFRTYDLFYQWDSFEAQNVCIYKKGYLPRPVIEYTLELYIAKNTLKNVAGKELEYALKKELLNSLYGMAVTSPLKDVLAYDESTDSWKPTTKDDEGNVVWLDSIYDMNLSESYVKYYEDKVADYNKKIDKGQIAIPFIQGVYISAIARFNLSLGILASGLQHLFVYSDTDSIYVQHADNIKAFIEQYNKNIEQNMLNMCSWYNFKSDIWKPKTVEGVEKPLGYWDFDGHSKYFKTLGAKRYMKIDDKDHLKITVAGLGKSQGCQYMLDNWGNEDGTAEPELLEHFKIGLTIPAERTGKLTHTIFRGDFKGIIQDYEYHIKGGVNLESTSFNMTMDDEYNNYVNNILSGVEDITFYV
jgi:hypothetical protein